ncbi:MAG: hypothetical protein RJA70_2073 [Pseudomonadota bacterium]|jgi:peroxiredoxin
MFRSTFLIVTLLGAALLTGCAGANKGEPSKDPGEAASEGAASEGGPEVGKPAPAFSLKSADGSKAISLGDLKGKVVVVDFWATWCDPCRESFPSYEKLAQEFPDTLAVVGVSVDEEPDGIADFGKSTGVKFPLLWDEGGKVAELYAPPKMPTSFVIDQEGVLRHIHAGYAVEEEEKLRVEIRALVDSK